MGAEQLETEAGVAKTAMEWKKVPGRGLRYFINRVVEFLIIFLCGTAILVAVVFLLGGIGMWLNVPATFRRGIVGAFADCVFLVFRRLVVDQVEGPASSSLGFETISIGGSGCLDFWRRLPTSTCAGVQKESERCRGSDAMLRVLRNRA